MVEAATPAPWGVNKYGAIGTGEHFIFGGHVIGACGFEEDMCGNAPELIVALRNNAAALLDVCEAAAALDSARDAQFGTPAFVEKMDALRAALEKLQK